MAKKDFNVIVIGGGSAGLVSSYIAAAVKAKVALIEKHKMGGDCLNTGCVPSKALIRSAKILSYIKRHKDYGIKSAEASFDFSEVMERVQSVINKVEPHDSVERYSSLGVDCFTGEAKILSPHEVSVNGKTLTTKNIIIATGARPAVPKIPGLDKVPYLTSDTLWEIRELPKRLVVVGGGPIGSELTQCFARLGSQVTQVERAPNIMIREDDEISQAIRKRFTEEGVDVRTSSNFKEVLVENGRQFAVIEKDGTTEKIEFDKIVIALGRAANSKGFGLEEIGVKLTQRGTVEVDEYLRTTTHKNIYACGDVAGPYQFTHTAAHQAWYCAVNALFSPLKKFKVDYSVIPWCTFTDPEVAQVGLNEKAAKAQGIPYEVTRYEIDDLDRAIADSEDHGVVKVLTVPGKDKILGVTILGYHAGDLIAEYVLAMKHGLGLNKILGTIHIYPTMAEANKFAAGNWKKAHAPEGLLRLVKKFHAWRR
jgi:dihydrolipoamide dehydrogenase